MVAYLEEDTTSTCFGLRAGVQMFMKWVRLMLVCRHWRVVGISSPSLWRRIKVTRNLQSLHYRLSRALDCTIDVFLGDEAATNESAMPLLLPFASNIRSIQTGDSFSDALPSIKPLFKLSLPALESIVLLPQDNMRFLQAERESGGSEEWVDLGLSGSLLPRLRKLEIRRIAMPSPPAFFTELREFVINMENIENPPLRAQDMVEILAHSPRLEAFKILSSPIWDYSSGLQISADVGPGIRLQCCLPYLREVVLSCPYDFATEILQAVDVPNLSLFRAEVFVRTPIAAGDISAHIFPPSLRHSVHRLTSLRIMLTEPSGFYLCGTCPVPRRSRHNHNCFWVEIAVQDYTGTIEPLDAALSTACTVFAGAPLTLMNITNFEMDDPSPDAWQRLDTTFPTLDTLRVACSALVAVSFLEAFVASSMGGSWSALRRLHISTASRGCYPLDSCGLHDMFALVLDALRARREHNADTVLGLEHTMKSSTPLAAHRWMLHSISSLCRGQFGFRRRNGHSRHFQVELSDLFQPGEWQRLSAEPPSPEDMTCQTGASDKVGTLVDTIQIEDSAEGAAEGSTGDNETAVLNGAKHSYDEGTAGLYMGEEYEHEEYSTLRSAVIEELLGTVPGG